MSGVGDGGGSKRKKERRMAVEQESSGKWLRPERINAVRVWLRVRHIHVRASKLCDDPSKRGVLPASRRLGDESVSLPGHGRRFTSTNIRTQTESNPTAIKSVDMM